MVDLADLERCAAMDGDAAKLACFEDLADSHRGNTAPAAESRAPVTVVPAPTAGAIEISRRPEPVESIGPTPEAAASAASDVGLAAGSKQSPRSTDEFGREHIEEDAHAAPAVMSARVMETVTRRGRGVTFHLDNGQVWQQEDDRYFPYPKGETFDVEISRGMMGDYRLRVGGKGRLIRIRRLR